MLYLNYKGKMSKWDLVLYSKLCKYYIFCIFIFSNLLDRFKVGRILNKIALFLFYLGPPYTRTHHFSDPYNCNLLFIVELDIKME